MLVLMATGLGSSLATARQSDTTGTAVYVIMEGDTFYELAARLGMTAQALAEMNDSISGVLRSGMRLRIPEEKVSSKYQVRSGDTLFGVADQFGVSVEALRATNRLQSSGLQVGQSLVIPGQGVQDSEPNGGVHPSSILETNALVYPDVQIDRMLASGLRYDPNRFTMSHPEYGYGSILLVRSVETGRSTFAEVLDRGSEIQPMLIDVSHAVAKHLWMDHKTTGRVEIRLIDERS